MIYSSGSYDILKPPGEKYSGVRVIVSRCRDYNCAQFICNVHCFFDNLRIPLSSPTVVDDVCAVTGRVNYCRGKSGIIASSITVQCFDRHNPGFGRHSDNSDSIVASRSNGAGHMRPMPMIIGRTAVAICKVPSPGVIDVAIVVIVNPVAGDFFRIGPYIGRNIRMAIINPRIHHGYRYPPPFCRIPCLRTRSDFYAIKVIKRLGPGSPA